MGKLKQKKGEVRLTDKQQRLQLYKSRCIGVICVLYCVCEGLCQSVTLFITLSL